jgi:hypothetical protein
MSQNNLTSLVTTASGFFGGMSRAFLGKITLTAVTINSLLEVALYAGTSALVGYAVKLAIDGIKRLYHQHKQRHGRS